MVAPNVLTNFDMSGYPHAMPAAPQLVQLDLSIDHGASQNLALGLEGAAWVFKALSDPARLGILAHLASGVMGCCGDGVCACDLEEVTGLSQPTVSHHMKCLQSAGLVRSEKRGKWMYYDLDPRGLEAARAFISSLGCC
jgi:ArsR family transcriptional regulator, arsenate/arsenite/antimonite-responsive transcriptional repressor